MSADDLGFSAEPALERVSRAVGQEGAHPCGCESRGGLSFVEAVLVAWVAVDALALGFAPGDAPCGVAGGGGEGDDVADVAWGRAEGPFEDGHAAHGAADGDGDGADGEVVEDEFVEALKGCRYSEERERWGIPDVIADGGGGKVRSVGFVSVGVGGDGGGGAVWGAENVGAKDEEAVGVECLAPAYEGAPPRVGLNWVGYRPWGRLTSLGRLRCR
jgi:hypothetical protein